jgi:hypothetical protein
MDKFDQMANAVAAAVVASKPPQEYCFLGVETWATCMTKGEWSGWVQAFGSIAAIVGMFFLAKYQHYQQKKADAESRLQQNKDRLNTLHTLIVNMQRTSTQVAKHVDSSASVGKQQYIKSQFLSAVHQLAASPIGEIQDKNLALKVMEILQHAKMAENVFDSRNTSGGSTPFSLLSTECKDVLDDYWPKSGEAIRPPDID